MIISTFYRDAGAQLATETGWYLELVLEDGQTRTLTAVRVAKTGDDEKPGMYNFHIEYPADQNGHWNALDPKLVREAMWVRAR
jgi:hypothetical protein